MTCLQQIVLLVCVCVLISINLYIFLYYTTRDYIRKRGLKIELFFILFTIKLDVLKQEMIL